MSNCFSKPHSHSNYSSSSSSSSGVRPHGLFRLRI